MANLTKIEGIKNISEKPSEKLADVVDNVHKNTNQDDFVLEEVIGITVASPNALDCSPENGSVAFPAACMLVLMHPKTNEQKFIESPTLRNISCVKFSADGRLLACGETGLKPTVTIWQIRELRELIRFNITLAIKSMLFHPKANAMVVLGENIPLITLWNYIDGTLLASCKWQTIPLSMTIPVCGSCFIVTGHRKITYFNMTEQLFLNNYETNVFDEKKSVLLGKQSDYTFVDITCGKGNHEKSVYTITACGYLCKITLGDILIDKAIKVDKHVFCLKFGMDSLFLGCCAGVVKICNPEELSVTADVSLSDMLGPGSIPKVGSTGYLDVCSLVVNEKGGIVTCSYADHSMYSWQINTESEKIECSIILKRSKRNNGEETVMNGSVNETKASLLRSFIGCYEKSANPESFSKHIAALPSSKLFSKYYQKHTVNGNRALSKTANALRFTPDGKDVIAGNEEGEIKVYDAESGNLRRVIEAHNSTITCIDLLYDDHYKLICSGGRDRIIFVLNAKNDFSLVQVLADHSAAIVTLNIFHNKSTLTLVSAAADNIITIRRAISGGPLKFMITGVLASNGPIKPYFFTNDFLALAGKNSEIKVFKVDPIFDPKPFRVINCVVSNGDSSGRWRAMDIDPSGSFIAVSQGSGHITIYYLETGQPVASLPLHTEVTGVTFTSDFRYMMSSIDNTVELVWRLPLKMTEFMRAKKGRQYLIEHSKEITYESYLSCMRICGEFPNKSILPKSGSEHNINGHRSRSEVEVTPSIESMSMLKALESDMLAYSTSSIPSIASYSTNVNSSILANDAATTDSSIHVNSVPVNLLMRDDENSPEFDFRQGKCVKVGAFQKRMSETLPSELSCTAIDSLKKEACELLSGLKFKEYLVNDFQRHENEAYYQEGRKDNASIQEEKRSADASLNYQQEMSRSNAIRSNSPVTFYSNKTIEASENITEEYERVNVDQSDSTESPFGTPKSSVKDLRQLFENIQVPNRNNSEQQVVSEKERNNKIPDLETPRLEKLSLGTSNFKSAFFDSSGLTHCKSSRAIGDIVNSLPDSPTLTFHEKSPIRKISLKQKSASPETASGTLSPTSCADEPCRKRSLSDSRDTKRPKDVPQCDSIHSLDKTDKIRAEKGDGETVPSNRKLTPRDKNEVYDLSTTKILSGSSSSVNNQKRELQKSGRQDDKDKSPKLLRKDRVLSKKTRPVLPPKLKPKHNADYSGCVGKSDIVECLKLDGNHLLGLKQALDKMAAPNIAEQKIRRNGDDSKTFDLCNFENGNDKSLVSKQDNIYHAQQCAEIDENGDRNMENEKSFISNNDNIFIEQQCAEMDEAMEKPNSAESDDIVRLKKSRAIQLSNSQETYPLKITEFEDTALGALLKLVSSKNWKLGECFHENQFSKLFSGLESLFQSNKNINESKSLDDVSPLTKLKTFLNEHCNLSDLLGSSAAEVNRNPSSTQEAKIVLLQTLLCMFGTSQLKSSNTTLKKMLDETITSAETISSNQGVSTEKSFRTQKISPVKREFRNPQECSPLKKNMSNKECKAAMQKSFTTQFLESLKCKVPEARRFMAKTNPSQKASTSPSGSSGSTGRSESQPARNSPDRNGQRREGFAAGLAKVYRRSRTVECKRRQGDRHVLSQVTSENSEDGETNDHSGLLPDKPHVRHSSISFRIRPAVCEHLRSTSPPKLCPKDKSSKSRPSCHSSTSRYDDFAAGLGKIHGGPRAMEKADSDMESETVDETHQKMNFCSVNKIDLATINSSDIQPTTGPSNLYHAHDDSSPPSPIPIWSSPPSSSHESAPDEKLLPGADGHEEECRVDIRNTLTTPIADLLSDHGEYLRRLKEVKNRFEESLQALSRERRKRKSDDL